MTPTPGPLRRLLHLRRALALLPLVLLSPALLQQHPALGRGEPRVRSHCRFSNRGTEYVNKSGMKWMRVSAKRQCDRALESCTPSFLRRGLRCPAQAGDCGGEEAGCPKAGHAAAGQPQPPGADVPEVVSVWFAGCAERDDGDADEPRRRALLHVPAGGVQRDGDRVVTWEKLVLSARGFKRVGRH